MNAMAEISLDQARRKLEADLRDAATGDAGFRARLLADPHAAIAEHLGFDPAPGIRIRVIEEGEGEAVLVLPRALGQDELPDALLDLASGGAFKGCKGDGWTLDKLNRMGID